MADKSSLRMTLIQREYDQQIMADAAEREYHRAKLALWVLRAQIIAEALRGRAAMNNMQTKGGVTRKAPKKLMMRNKGSGKSRSEKTRATKKNVRRP